VSCRYADGAGQRANLTVYRSAFEAHFPVRRECITADVAALMHDDVAIDRGGVPVDRTKNVDRAVHDGDRPTNRGAGRDSSRADTKAVVRW